jgi:adenosylcobyric acid synthase
MSAKTIMIQGTASNVGKSIVTTALCRILKRRGFKVAPFKAQNMANNSYVTIEGGEIGRAQAVQALASGVLPSQCMNPILLKPSSDRTSQVVVMGKPAYTLSAKEYQLKKIDLLSIVEKALNQLREEFDIVVIEGAGSPAEINMKEKDIVNMRVAKMVGAPVILVADIDKGGVFAQIIGTYELLDPDEKNLVKGFLINKFRGDKDILMPGIQWIERRMGKPCLGVIPMIKNLEIDQEDGVVLDELACPVGRSSNKILIQVIRLPRISNFTDFEVLSREKDVELQYIEKPDRHCLPDVLILPGTKSTMADLQFLRSTGFEEYIQRCVKFGVMILGICGGYQMLGDTIEDPQRMESSELSIHGLGLLRMKTIFKQEKTTVQIKAVHLESQCPIEGYEIHMGHSIHNNGNSSFCRVIERQGQKVDDPEGSHKILADEQSHILGTYIHGLFDNSEFRRYFLNQIRKKIGLELLPSQIMSDPRNVYDALADAFEEHLDMNILNEILGEVLV